MTHEIPPPPPNSDWSGIARPPSGRRLHAVGWVGLLAFTGWQIYTTEVDDPLLIFFGCAIIVLAALPALQWAKRDDLKLPSFELLMLGTIPFYALPLLRQHPATLLFPTEVLEHSAQGIILFLIAALTTRQLVHAAPLNHRCWKESLFDERHRRLPMLGIVANATFLFLINFTNLVPSELFSVLRALFFGVGITCTFIVSRMWGGGELTVADKAVVAIGLALQFVLMASSLYLISATSLVLLAVVGYVTERRRIPLVLLTFGFLLIAVLHNGKNEMRRIYWFGEAHAVRLSELPAFFGQWIGYGLDFGDEAEQPITTGILERTSLFHIMCIVIDQTPRHQPYLAGETYRGIPFFLIPRLIWPDKPAPHESNRRLAIAYGFSTEESAHKVSIAFGAPAEAYANFGMFGLAVLGMFYGFLFKKIECWFEGCPILSLGGLVTILLVAWSFQAEMVLAVWLSSLFQAIVALLAIPLSMKFFLNR